MNTPKLITMLTHNDVTSERSLEIFLGAKDAPCDYWGFKDVGLSEPQMKELVDAMQAAGKTVFLETLAYSEADTLASMEMALRCGFDYMLGGTYYQSAAELALANNLRFSPFVGNRHSGHLYGDMDEIVAQVRERNKKDVYGLNVSAYRYDGDADELVRRLVAAAEKPLSIVGSINDFARLDSVKATGCWAFTIGGAFFEDKFGEGFSKQIEVVQNYINR